MSKADIKTQQKKLTTLKVSLLKLRSTLAKQFKQKRNELISPILQNISDAIAAVAKADGLDFVINKSLNTGSIIFYASGSQKDITQEVIDRVKSNSNK